jgi:Fe-Mn family superoxide dismutase
MNNILVLAPLPYTVTELSPAMSAETLDYHYENLARGYVTRFNNNEGDPVFNEAGAFLHNIFFQQLQPYSETNEPFGESLNFINHYYEDFSKFKQEIKKTAFEIQGSGWVYLSSDGKIRTIKNHAIFHDIVVLIDWWEHSWALDYHANKGAYIDNIWNTINWSIINEKLPSYHRDN